MAAKYRRIDPRIWNDEGFRNLEPEEKLVAFEILTAQANRIGLFSYSMALGAEHINGFKQFFSNGSIETFQERFVNVLETLRWTFDSGPSVLYVPTWWKYNRPDNPNVLKGCLSDLHDVPQTPLIKEFLGNVEFLTPACQIVLGNVCGNVTTNVGCQEQEQDQEQE